MTSGKYLIRNGNVVTPSAVRRLSILIEEGRFSRIGDVPQADAGGARVIDASGRLVLPGLVELHVQGAGGIDLLAADPHAARKLSHALARFGTTAFLATTGVDTTREDQPHIRSIVETPRCPPGGAELLGIYLEGPFVSPEKRGMIQPTRICAVNRRYHERIKALCGGRLRIMTIAPELPGALELIEDLASSGIVPALGHTNATYEEAMRGIEAGLSHVTHVANAMRSLHHREPGAFGAALMSDALTMEIIADGVHLHPALVKWLIRTKGPSRFAIITDGMAAMGMPPGRYTHGSVQYTVHDGVARYEDGTLIGTACTQLELVRRAIRFTGLAIQDVVAMASLHPARALGLDARKGSIEVGKEADLVICDPAFNVEAVFVRGEPAEAADQAQVPPDMHKLDTSGGSK